MNNLKLIIIAGAAMASTCAFSQEVNVAEPGSLSSLITDYNTTTLSVSGKINAQDLFFISENLPTLTSLNLSKVTIERYSGEVLHGQTEYAAGFIPNGTFAATAISEVSLPTTGNITIGDLAFADTKLTSVALPSSVKSIGMAAFACCNGLTTLQVPTCAIGSYAFSDCTNITSVQFGANTEIAEGAFARCTNLSNVSGSTSLLTIGDYSFMGCTSLQTFTFGSDLKSIGQGAFDGTGLSSVNLTGASNLKNIGARAFANNTSLTSVSFSNDKSVTLGEGVFFGCTSLSNITLPAVSELPDYALSDAAKVQTLNLPSTVGYIGDNAMTGMTGLESIDVTELTTVPDLGTDVWHYVDQPKITAYAGEQVIDAFKAADQWKLFSFTISTNVVNKIEVGDVSIKGRFEGDELHVIASGGELASIALYDVAGVNLTTVAVSGEEATISTADYSTQIYIVKATLKNGNIATVKLIRK